ncbi:hypothetical protein GTCCBUS3UF5_36210 [Geobacillus thermoleovorans CCB_US3_UF5]|uniref:Transposase n=1 Tax=Geobacillus thermoleovorans CCB_US3_UF5 TaxID=1111068 RepID=A0ABM5MN27_GEOTH|nr:hypothetical protein GTCCBUS3UF5_36210 [Geobacillus thermoleovorans CCB_US3_UF5]
MVQHRWCGDHEAVQRLSAYKKRGEHSLFLPKYQMNISNFLTYKIYDSI